MSDYVVIPAYNEHDQINEVITKVQAQCDRIIVVDDGSTDQTSSIAKSSGVTVLKHAVNLGKGAALVTGCNYAFMHGADRVVVLDSDGQHDPQEIPVFLKALDNNDIVFGYRKKSTAMPLVLKFGNWFINKNIKILFGININDTQCGYRAFTADAYRKICWNSTDYFMETEMIIKVSKSNLKYQSIPIETIYSDNYKGTTIVDGFKIVLKMWGERLLR